MRKTNWKKIENEFREYITKCGIFSPKLVEVAVSDAIKAMKESLRKDVNTTN